MSKTEDKKEAPSKALILGTLASFYTFSIGELNREYKHTGWKVYNRRNLNLKLDATINAM